MPSRLSSQLRDAARAAAPVAGALVLAIGARAWLQRVVDLSDLPGAAGVLTVSRATAAEFHRSWAVWFIGLVAPLTQDDISAAALLVALLSSSAMVIGAALGGWAVAGRAGAMGATLAAGAWSLALLPGLVVGADPPSIGLAWLGVGLAWAGARAGAPGLPWLAVGTVLAVLAAAVKELALPALPLLLATPLLLRGRWGVVLAQLPVQAVAGWWAWSTLAPRRVHGAASMPEARVESLVGGLQRVLDLPLHGWAEGTFHQVMALALVAGVLPGRRQGTRLLMALGSVALVAATAAALDRRVRPRLLLTASYGIVVMLGVGAAVAAVWLEKLRLRRLPLLVLPIALGLDTWAWLDAYITERASFAETAASPLPAAPAAWARRYATPNLSDQRDLTLAGAATLRAIVEDGVHRGVATPRLRDDRHRHLDAYGGLAGKDSVILDRGKCCTGLDEATCAHRLVSALDAAGVTLALPIQTKAVRRVNRQDDAWLGHLQAAARRAGDVEVQGQWWMTRAPTGTAGALPCQKPGGGAKRPSSTEWPPPLPSAGDRPRPPGGGPKVPARPR